MSSAACAPSSSYFKCEKTREQLILAVQGYPCLWDTSIDSYHIFGAKQSVWEEVANSVVVKVSLYDMVVWWASDVHWLWVEITLTTAHVIRQFKMLYPFLTACLTRIFFKSIAEDVIKLPAVQVYHISVFFVCLKLP